MRLANVFASIAAIAAVLVTSPVRADDPAATDRIARAPDAPPTEPPSDRWYGWQTLIVDSVAAGGFVVGVGKRIDSLSVTGLLLYGAGPPVVHGLHGHWGLALGDLALRVAAPVLLAIVGVGLEDATTPDCRDTGDICLRGLGGALAGAATGYAAAVATDAALLARERETTSSRREPRRAALLLIPVVNTGKSDFAVGIAGRF